MKKRAVISAVAGIALAGVMCVSFAACGGGGADAKSVKGEEVTKEVWDAAFDYTKFEETYANFKLEESVESVVDAMGIYKVTSTGDTTYTFADKLTYVKGKAKTKISGDVPSEVKKLLGDGTVEYEYYADKDGKFIEKKDGEWKEVNTSSSLELEYSYTTATDKLMSMVYRLPSMDFEDYEFSAENKGYVAKEADEGEFYVLKFVDNKLAAVYVEITFEGMTGKTELTYNYVMTYGGQSVTLPA